MSARHLIIGLDGADLRIIYTLGRRRLPALFALMERGVVAPQRSVDPPATLPNWTTFLTALGPGEHGVFDFTSRRGYRVRFDGAARRSVPTWIARLDALGEPCALVGFPATYPPERLRHGVCISGWDAPVAFQADASFVWPPALHAQLVRRFGALTFDEVDQFRADQPGWHDALGEKLVRKIARRLELAHFLLSQRRFHTFAFYFGESDTASHYLYSLHDEASPRRPSHVSARGQAGLSAVYQALDRAVDELVARVGPGAEVTVVSDHGSGGSSNRVLYLNRALEALGFLRFKPSSRAHALPSRAKDFALTALPPKLRESLFRLGSTALPSWLESRVRFAAIDMDRTQAFSDELNYFPAIYLNQRGREPRGQVAREDRERVLSQLSEALLGLRDPVDGSQVVARVQRREALFVGPRVADAPDLLLELAELRGYSWNLVPSALAAANEGFTGTLSPAEYLGKKGRSLPGSHRPHGLFIAAGPRVSGRGRIELGIEDAAVSVLARMDLAPPSHSRGVVPEGLLARTGATHLPEAPSPRGRARSTSSVVERLRALGYVD